VVNQLYDHNRLGLRFGFLRYSFADIFLAIRAGGGVPVENQKKARIGTAALTVPGRPEAATAERSTTVPTALLY
jgi:hypothetical protein